MNFIRNLFKPSAPAAPTHVIHEVKISGRRDLPTDLRHASALKRRPTIHYSAHQSPKRGMWVRYQDRTGILTDLQEGDLAVIMLVDDQFGMNVLQITAAAQDVRQAHIHEIPEPRRPDKETAQRMGYST